MRNSLKTLRIGVLAATALLLNGCMSYSQMGGSKTGLVEFLYPTKTGYVESVNIPQLSLPLRVGIAFTPPAQQSYQSISAVEKQKLAEQVAEKFEALEFVDNITLIPSDYLRAGGSFTNLEQLRQLFGVDVIVLLSYDQTVLTTQGIGSLAYWTIVGAYVVPGEKNDTQTLLDAAVYDIGSRQMLFRAPGTSVVKSRNTMIGNEAKLHANSVEGFVLAGDELKKNLSAELDNFTTRVKTQPSQFQVTMREGYSGSGSNEGLFLLAVCGLLLTALVQGKQTGGRQ